MIVRPRALVAGLRSYSPLFGVRDRGTGGTDSARYCYSVWLRHLVFARDHGLRLRPGALVELGPGDSLGIGLAGLVSGAQSYVALDAVRHADIRASRAILRELAGLFRARADIPGPDEFPDVQPGLAEYAFPHDLWGPGGLEEALSPARLERIEADLAAGRGMVRYVAPWDGADVLGPGVADLVFSQAVLEHVADPEATYSLMAGWLRPGGVMSHSVDFGSHGMSGHWNGHWACGDLIWRLVRGRRGFFLNRLPCSAHAAILGRLGLEPVAEARVLDRGGLPRERFVSAFRGMSGQDAVTRGAHMVWIRPKAGS
ncbi:MAG: hypothetical protein PHV85_11955 [Desulfovibrionaceae bacterium]|nr:hypothetical protein [Desulfovibrionaceae bacterium]